MQLLLIYSLLFKQFFFLTDGFTCDTNRLKKLSNVSYRSSVHENCECGKKNLELGEIRIVSGVETSENEYPWMALITGNGAKLAGGSLISDHYVVTAAHILDSKMNEMRVILGVYNFCMPSTRKMIYSIDKLIVHPEYDRSTLYADIMLVRIFMKVIYTDFVRPICLPMIDLVRNTGRVFKNMKASVLGWGLAEIGRDVCILRIVDLVISASEYCEYNPGRICAGSPDGKRDSCSGDSGGPLQILNSRGKYKLIGVVSSGLGCGTGTPGYYTDVSQMVQWIRQMTTDSTYCMY